MTASRPHGDRARHKHGPDENGTPGNGCCCTDCREASNAYDRRRYRMIAYGCWQPRTDAAGTRRRLQALVWNGRSPTVLAARLGCTRQTLQQWMGTGRVSTATAAKVRALYDELWDQAPPEETRQEKRVAGMARRYARERGWVPAGAWDDDPGPYCIDDPAAVPVPGWDAEREPQPATGSPLVAAGIRAARQRAGMSQRALAEAVGVTATCVQLYEYAKRTPSAKTWEQLELTLGPLGVVRAEDPEPAAREEASDAA